MAIDRTLDLRPATIDIADNVDDILKLLTPVIYDKNAITFETGFEPYNETVAEQKIKITKVNNFAIIQGAIKKTPAQSSAGSIKCGNIISDLRPTQRFTTVEVSGGVNRFGFSVYPNGDLFIVSYGTATNIAIPNNAYLRIDCCYYLG